MGLPDLPTGGPARVLVMLDQPLVAQIVAFTLSHGAHETRTVTSVDEATPLLASVVGKLRYDLSQELIRARMSTLEHLRQRTRARLVRSFEAICATEELLVETHNTWQVRRGSWARSPLDGMREIVPGPARS
jgi:hypothetical protein